MAAREPREHGDGRVPPHSVEAEDSLLGAMLLSRDAITEALEIVEEGDFFQPSLRHIFASVVQLYAAGEPTDVVSVADLLKRNGLLEQVGGSERLVGLQASTPAITSASRYAQIVRDYALLRRLIGAATQIAEQAYAPPSDVQELIDFAEAKILEVAKGNRSDSATPIRDVLWDTLEELEQLFADGGAHTTATTTGFHDLDEKLAGLHRSNLVIVGARPGMGKTAFALSMASKVSHTLSQPVLIFSLEMSRGEIGQRLLAAEAKVDSSRIRSGRLSEQEWDKISHAAGRLAERQIYIDDDPNITVLDVRARSRRLRAQEGLGLIIVDYLQLMSSRRNVESRQVEVSEISRGLKLLARELDVPVVALSQLSRNLEQRHDKRPQLADLRESGCLAWESRVLLEDGSSVPIGLLWSRATSDFRVLAVDDAAEVVGAGARRVVATGVRDLIEVGFEDGSRLRATAAHPLRTKAGFAPAGSLTAGTEVLGVDDRGQVVARCVTDMRPAGRELVFDMEVPSQHSFVAEGVSVHNSLEQDADVVLFIYRDEVYQPDSPDRGSAEVIIAKHRNGPVGTVTLAFIENWALFVDIAHS